MLEYFVQLIAARVVAELGPRLNQIDAALAAIQQQITQEGQTMTVELQALTDQVAQNTNLEQSAITLITGLAKQIGNASEDPVAVQALAAQLQASASALADALSANTPAAPQASKKK